MTLICAACGEPGDADPCVACGGAILLVGRYQLVEVLGRGRSGVTFRALRVSDGANVAIKEMPLRGAANDKARALYQREARVLQQLSHPRIPRHVEDFVAGRGKHAGIFLVEELVEGRDLGRELEERRYDEAEVLDVLRCLLPILVYLHGRSPPVIHRDIKPRNVMRRPDGELVLLDFGAVRDAVVDSELGGSTVAGTFGYMAPEQFRGDATVTTDIYGLGALAVALLTRREPHTLTDSAGRIRWKSHANASPAVVALLDRLLDPEPERRPDAEAALAEVRRLCGRVGHAVPTELPERAPSTVTVVPTSVEPLFEPAPFVAPLARRPPKALVPVVVSGVVATGVLGFLAWTLGAFLHASSAEAPAPQPAPVTACVPRMQDDEGPVPATTSRFAFIGGSPDGKRVALAVGRQSDGRGELLVYEAGGAVPLRERVIPPAEVRVDWATYLATLASDTRTLRDEGIDLSVRPERVAWCQDGAAVRIGEETWRFDHFEAPCAVGMGTSTSFQLCPPNAVTSASCVQPPRLSVGCWDGDPVLVGVYRLGEAVWAVAERPHGEVVARFAAGVIRPDASAPVTAPSP